MNAPRWYAVYTNIKCEKRAALSIMDGLRERDPLNELGLAVYLPCETLWAKHARKRERVTKPLFNRYLFVFIREDDMHVVRACDGVEDFVRACGLPAAVSLRDVNNLRDTEESGAFDATRDAEFDGPFKADDLVEVSLGKFTGWPGRVLAMTADNRVRVLLSMFGKAHEKELDVAVLRAAA